jgi:hypothetical protein
VKNKKYIGMGILSLFLLFGLSGIVVAQATVVNVSPSTQNVAKGETFTIDITIDPGASIAGAQFDLSFNPALVSVNSMTEGNLLKQGGANTYFSPGTIDNTAGTITGVAGAITTPGQTVSSSGVFATIQMTAKSVDGTSLLDLSNVIVGDINGNPVSITVNDGSVTVGVSPTPTPSPSPTPTPTPGATTVNITPPTQTVATGSPFTVNVTVDSKVPIAGKQQPKKLESVLYQLTKEEKRDDFAETHGLYLEYDKVRVVIELNNTEHLNRDETVKRYNGIMETYHENLVQALVPVDNLIALSENPNVVYVRTPLIGYPQKERPKFTISVVTILILGIGIIATFMLILYKMRKKK